MKHKGGRPKIDISKKKATQFFIKCTHGEKNIIKDRAKEYGLTITDFILRKCLDQKIVFNHVEYLKEIHALNLELGRQGNNINQLAKYV